MCWPPPWRQPARRSGAAAGLALRRWPTRRRSCGWTRASWAVGAAAPQRPRACSCMWCRRARGCPCRAIAARPAAPVGVLALEHTPPRTQSSYWRRLTQQRSGRWVLRGRSMRRSGASVGRATCARFAASAPETLEPAWAGRPRSCKAQSLPTVAPVSAAAAAAAATCHRKLRCAVPSMARTQRRTGRLPGCATWMARGAPRCAFPWQTQGRRRQLQALPRRRCGGSCS